MSANEMSAPALVVVDLQASTAQNARAHSADDWLANAATLVGVFRAKNLPVVMATSLGTPPGRTAYGAGAREWPDGATMIVPEISPAPDDIRIERRSLSVFAGTDLAETLRDSGVTEVVFVGIATSFGVESSARAAYDLGFDVVVVSDAIADLQQESHERSLVSVLPVVSRVLTTVDVTQALP